MPPPAQAGGPPTLSEGPALPGGVRSVGERRMGVKNVGSRRRPSWEPRLTQVWELCVCVRACTCMSGDDYLCTGKPLSTWVTCYSSRPSCRYGYLWACHLSLSASLFLLSDTLEYSLLLQSSRQKSTGSCPKGKGRVSAQWKAGTGSFLPFLSELGRREESH